MPKFHRFTAPSYYGAPSLGAPPLGVVTFEGVDYDLFNVVTAGTGGGGSSFMDGYKTVGPNVGTYAVAFGEDASSSNANRGFRALAENTDVLDDLVHRDLALPLVTSLATSDGTATYGSAVLPVDTFIGSSPTYSLGDLFSIVDNNDREIIDPATYAKVTVTGISEAIGGGFSTGALTLTFSQNVPNGVQFKIYYSSRGNLATMPVDSLSYIRVRGAEEVSAEVQKALRQIQSPVSVGGYPWNGPPITTLWDLALGGLQERYRKASAYNPSGPSYQPVISGPDVPGAGGWFQRTTDNSPGITGYTAVNRAPGSGLYYFGKTEHMLGGMWNVAIEDTIQNLDEFDREAVTSGFVFLGNGKTSLNDATDYSPGVFSFYAGMRRTKAVPAVPLRTTLVGATFSLSGNTLTLTSGSFTALESGSPRSAIACGVDLLRVTIGGTPYTFVVWYLTNSTTAVVTTVEGCQVSIFPAVTGVIDEWVRTKTFFADGAASEGEKRYTLAVDGSELKGFMWAAPPVEEANAPAGNIIDPEHARFYAREKTSSSIALAWGGYNQNGFGPGGFKYDDVSYLYGDGSMDLYSFARVRNYLQVDTDIIVDKRILQKSQTTALVSPTVDASAAQFIYWNVGSQNGTSPTLTMTLTNLTASSWTSGRLVVAVRRVFGCLASKVSFSIAGVTSFLDPTDALLQPIATATTYWDVYEARFMDIGGTVAVFWTVSRYSA